MSETDCSRKGVPVTRHGGRKTRLRRLQNRPVQGPFDCFSLSIHRKQRWQLLDNRRLFSLLIVDEKNFDFVSGRHQPAGRDFALEDWMQVRPALIFPASGLLWRATHG